MTLYVVGAGSTQGAHITIVLDCFNKSSPGVGAESALEASGE